MKKILVSYLKKQSILFIIIIFSNIVLIFSTISLYNIEKEPVLYPIFIELFLLICFFIYDYFMFSRKYKILELLQNNLDAEIKNIKKTEDILENKYIDVINNLALENKKIILENKKQTKEIIDYYTMWVHQIKNPIAALSFLIENNENTYKKQQEIELFKIEQYVDMVINYLRLDSDKNDLVIEKIKVEEVINSVLKKYASLFFSKNLKIDYTSIDLFIISDKKWLEFILEQLINNAIKYSKKQGIIKIYIKENNLIIEDEGIGISADNLPRIFDKGYTGFNGRKTKKSSGLGLYLTKKTTDKLGFLIKIDSEINKGTRVIITFDKDIIL